MVKSETSYGIIPLKKFKEEWHVLLINHKKGGFWAFPKGHGEKDESPLRAAERELLEETGLAIHKILSEHSLQEAYDFYRGSKHIHKTVYYYLAEVDGTVKLQAEEVYDSKWVKLSEADRHITFSQAKELARQALQLLKKDEG